MKTLRYIAILAAISVASFSNATVMIGIEDCGRNPATPPNKVVQVWKGRLSTADGRTQTADTTITFNPSTRSLICSFGWTIGGQGKIYVVQTGTTNVIASCAVGCDNAGGGYYNVALGSQIHSLTIYAAKACDGTAHGSSVTVALEGYTNSDGNTVQSDLAGYSDPAAAVTIPLFAPQATSTALIQYAKGTTLNHTTKKVETLWQTFSAVTLTQGSQNVTFYPVDSDVDPCATEFRVVDGDRVIATYSVPDSALNYEYVYTLGDGSEVVSTTLNNEYTSAVMTENGLQYESVVTAAQKAGAVSLMGSQADELGAANELIALGRNQLLESDAAGDLLGAISSTLDEIAANDDPGTVGVDYTPLLTESNRLLDEIRVWSDPTEERYGEQTTSAISSTRSALAASAAENEALILNAIQGAGLGGSASAPGFNSPDGGGDMTLTIFGHSYDFDPEHYTVWSAVFCLVRSILSWAMITVFMTWWLGRFEQGMHDIIMVPSPTLNVNPHGWGLTAAVSLPAKVAIWSALIVTFPAIFSAMADTAAGIGGLAGFASVLGGPDNTEISGSGGPLSIGWHLVTMAFPYDVFVNLAIVRLTFNLFYTTHIQIAIFVQKYITGF